jgi:hypothetical protein
MSKVIVELTATHRRQKPLDLSKTRSLPAQQQQQQYLSFSDRS